MKPMTSLKESLDDSEGKAIDLLHLIKNNATDNRIKETYRALLDVKHPLYNDTLFMTVETLKSRIEIEDKVELDERDVKDQVEMIDLATFAYNVLRKEEYSTCVNSFFKVAVPYYDKYTADEISLYLTMRLYLLRSKMNDKGKDADANELILQMFPKKKSVYFFNVNDEGSSQILDATSKVSSFLRQHTKGLNLNVRFGAVAMVKSFLQKFINYRMDTIGSNGRIGDEYYPKPGKEISDLVANIFDDKTIDRAMQGEIKYENERNEQQSDQEGSSFEETDDDGEDDNSYNEEINQVDRSPTAAERDINSDSEAISSTPNNNEAEVYQLIDDEDEETVLTITQTKHSHHTLVPRARITDEQPDAREITADEADFPRTKLKPSIQRNSTSSDSDGQGTSTPAPPISPSISPSKSPSKSPLQPTRYSRFLPILPTAPTTRDIAESTYSPNVRSPRSPTSAPPTNNTTSNNKRHAESPIERGEREDSVPEGYYIVEKTQERRKIAKTRERALRWTPEEVQALEDGLQDEKKRAWASILSRYRPRLGEHTQTQLKDKAVNEVKRRKKLNLPLGGFYYVEHPKLDK